ncbi:hypothetical protein IAT38_003569 [Cryptococcus sp. DSM 104549]
MAAQSIATKQQFEAASSWLSSAPAAAGLSNDIKLELYGLFKFITTGEGPSTSRPSIFYPTPRAKYDAWVAQTTKYTAPQHAPEQAQGRYVAIARSIGWDESAQEDEIDLERLSDSEDEDDLGELGAGGAVGKGKEKEKWDKDQAWRRVSVMKNEGEGGAEGLSPIHEAVIADSTEEVQRLLGGDKGLIDLRDEFGYTPLHLAADRGYPEMTKLLLKLGANPEIQDEDGQTPLMLADISSRDDIIAILRPS